MTQTYMTDPQTLSDQELLRLTTRSWTRRTCKARPSSPNETSACTGSHARAQCRSSAARDEGVFTGLIVVTKSPSIEGQEKEGLDGLLTAWCTADELPILWMTLSRTRNE
jgi:hypothetical protein